MTTVDFRLLQNEIEQLSPDSLTELQGFVEYLRFKEQRLSSRPLKEMYEAFAPIREAVDQSGLSEKDIDALIDEAIDDVRHNHNA
ncbi:MAG: hypothetical protein LCI00_14500 [Chloroflexi bacterium]|nr:hypothetical protein [Chloroflexota bacterium]MCC6892551.1 hypothetical protein [Anaerolineae bacterium]